MNTTSHFAKAICQTLGSYSGLKVRDITAQGSALGLRTEGNQALKGRNKTLVSKIYRAPSGLLKNVNASSQGVATLYPGLVYFAPSALRSSAGLIVLLFLLVLNDLSAQTKPLYENNFEKAEVGKVPEEFLVLDGQFTVKEENGNKIFELPGAPLDAFGVLFGPTETSDVLVSARIFGTAKGRRAPTFGVGANGVGGYRLQVSPGKKLLELYKGDEVVQSVAYVWKSGAWTELRLQVRKVKDGEFKVEGKAWTKDTDEPKEWLLSHDDTSPAAAGRASIWGSPYADTAIQFDDLSVGKTTSK